MYPLTSLPMQAEEAAGRKLEVVRQSDEGAQPVGGPPPGMQPSAAAQAPSPAAGAAPQVPAATPSVWASNAPVAAGAAAVQKPAVQKPAVSSGGSAPVAVAAAAVPSAPAPVAAPPAAPPKVRAHYFRVYLQTQIQLHIEEFYIRTTSAGLWRALTEYCVLA